MASVNENVAPLDYRLSVASQIRDGAILDIIKEELDSKPVDSFADKAFKLENAWHVQLKYIAPCLDRVLPVEKFWAPVQDEATDAFMYFIDGKKLYFKKNPELINVTDEEWLQYQIQRGNCFYANIGNYAWKLSPEQQGRLESLCSGRDIKK